MSLFGDPRSAKVAEALGASETVADAIASLGGVISPWHLSLDFDPSVTAQVAAQGGASIALAVGGGPLGASLGNITGAFNLALMWDDEQPAIVQTVEEGQTLVVKIGPPLGERLSCWTDSVISVSLQGVSTPEAADAIAAKLGANAPAPSFVTAIGDALKGGLGRLVDFQQTTTQTFIVVGVLGVLGYFLLRGPIDAVAAKVAGEAA